MADKYQNISTGFVPRSKRTWVAKQKNIKGGFHQFGTLEEFQSDLHPDLMEQNMEIVIGQHQRGNDVFPVSKFILDTVPTVADYPLSLTEGDANYFGNFFRLLEELNVQQVATVYQYAPDINGLKPTYPYLLAQESSWENTYDPTKNHKWLRFRNTDRDINADGIYDDWSIPRPINGNFSQGDYVENRFLRNDIKPVLPATTINGIKNNVPAGWTDVPPAGTATLWEIKAQKDVYGNLKTDWIGPFEIPEDEDIVRYNSKSTPNPNTLAGITEAASNPSTPDTDLTAAGWVKVFNPDIHVFKAQRVKNGVNDYTEWEISKISEESGEYTEFIYKLFPANADFDDPTFIANNTPTIDNPIEGASSPNTGWSDIPQVETATHINYVSSARKFFDGTLKSSWSSPRPFSGVDSYSDVITSGGQNSFKYTSSSDVTPTPATITLTYKLFKGLSQITSGLTYKWYKVYNNDAASEPTLDGNGFPISAPIGTNSTLVVSPADVTGKAIFRCYAILAVTGGTDILFSDEEPIVDITDGDDAKSLIISPESQLTVYNASTTNYSVATIRLRYYQSFLDGETFTWFKWNGVSWDALSNGVGGYTISGNLLSIASSDLFTEDTTAEEARFAISTHASDPENASAYSDQQTVGKTGVSNGTATDGTDGADSSIALLDNEAHNIVLDQLTGNPQTGEVAKAKTLLSVYTGNLKKIAGTDYTIGLASDNGDVTFASTDLGNDYEIAVNTWGANETSAVCTITITYGSLTLIKKFTVTATYDNAGATIADIDLGASSPNKTFTFTPINRGAEIWLEAKLYQNGVAVDPANITSFTWAFNKNTTLPTFTGTGGRFDEETIASKKDIIRINRDDALNVIAVSCVIVYAGKTYTAVGITIDDVLDNKSFILYYTYDTVPAEPLTKPTKPVNGKWDDAGDIAVWNTAKWYKTTDATKTYWACYGTELSDGDITFGEVFRIKGEAGSQGPASDFIVTLYKKNSGSLEGLANNATITQMTTTGLWSKVPPAIISTDILYQAVGNFDSAKYGNDGTGPDGIWTIAQLNALNGINGDPGSPGSPGSNGTDGKDPEFQRNGDNLEWRYADQEPQDTWKDLGSVKGDAGNDAIANSGIASSTIISTTVTSRSADTPSATILSIPANFNDKKCVVMINAAGILNSTTGVWFGIQKQINGGAWTTIKESLYRADSGSDQTTVICNISDYKLASETNVIYRANFRYIGNSYNTLLSGGLTRVDSNSIYIEVQ